MESKGTSKLSNSRYVWAVSLQASCRIIREDLKCEHFCIWYENVFLGLQEK